MTGSDYILLIFYTSGNRTPSSRLWPFGYLCLHPLARTQASFKALGCSYNCRRLTYGSFQLTHMSRDHTLSNWSSLSRPWQPKRRQNIITALTTLPQGWVSVRKHQCTTAITTMWTESSWAFPENYTARSCVRAILDNGDKRAHSFITKVSFCTIIIRWCHCLIAITRV